MGKKKTAAKAPPVAEWPLEVRNFIARRLVARVLAVWGASREGRAEGWRRLLVATYSGEKRDGVRLPYVLSVDDAYRYALEDMTHKEA